jgi:hypothetical protein
MRQCFAADQERAAMRWAAAIPAEAKPIASPLPIGELPGNYLQALRSLSDEALVGPMAEVSEGQLLEREIS